MKRYRIYYQQNARMTKIYGEYHVGQNNTMVVPRCGYDTLQEAEDVAKFFSTLNFKQIQVLILDFNQRGKIMSIL